LGTGGLARAYSDSVKMALEELQTREKIHWEFASLSLDYSEQAAVEKTFKETAVEIVNTRFDEKVTLDVRFDRDILEEINIRLGNLSQGKLRVDPLASD